MNPRSYIKGPSMDTKINVYILPIFLKVQNVVITLTVTSVPSVLSTWRNLPLKSTIYENHVEKHAAILACRRPL